MSSFFFFSSRRRHTRFDCDWSSDVCSSDLDRLAIRRNHYTVVGLTRRMVSSSGDPMVFIPLKDAQEAQFLKDNDAIRSEEHTSELQSQSNLVCRLLLEKKKKKHKTSMS